MTQAGGSSEDELQACYQRTFKQGSERGLAIVRLPGARDGFICLQVKGALQTWTFDVDCKSNSSTNLPRVFLKTPLIELAHVSRHGLVCVNDGQGLSIDKSRNTDIVAQTVLDAYELLEKSAIDAASGSHEFFNELEGYWGGFSGIVASSSVEINERSRLINGYMKYSHGIRTCPFFSEVDADDSSLNKGRLSRAPGLYLALDRYIETPSPNEVIDARFVDGLIDKLGSVEKALWDWQLKRFAFKKSTPFSLLLSVPRAAGGRSLVGLLFNVKEWKVDATADITPFNVHRHTATYMRERGGAKPALARRHVVVLGCGSIGSEAADALASSGVGHLTLVDPDQFMHDNVFRHVLGQDAVGAHKASALKENLERKYPSMVVDVDIGEAQVWLKSNSLSRIDGIVIAIGQPTLERDLYRFIRAVGQSLPVVITWLEPLDLGGHSFLFQTDLPGCLDCLFRDEEGDASLSHMTAFLLPDQRVTRNLTGCSSIFVPYGAIQSRRTALLAAEQMLLALDGKKGPAYEYWVGSGEAAQREGLKPSLWWSRAKNNNAREVASQLFGNPCPRCRISK